MVAAIDTLKVVAAPGVTLTSRTVMLALDLSVAVTDPLRRS